MVSPSCCLEYRPTLHLCFIVLFVIFPTIYLCGKVVGCFLTVLLRVLRGICRFLLWDDADYEEENRKMTEEKETEIRRIIEEREARREEARKRRREERLRLREEAKEELKEILAAQTLKMKPNGAPKTTVIPEEKLHRSDHSDSLISECEDENSQATSGVVLSEPKTNGLRHRHK